MKTLVGLLVLVAGAPCTGMSIGEKGMIVAAKALALSAVDLYLKPEIVKAAWADLEERKAGYPFMSLLLPGKRAPKSIR